MSAIPRRHIATSVSIHYDTGWPRSARRAIGDLDLDEVGAVDASTRGRDLARSRAQVHRRITSRHAHVLHVSLFFLES